MDWVSGWGHRVVVTDEAHQQSDSEPNTVWRLYEHNLKSGATKLIDHSDGGSRNVPTPSVADGLISWVSRRSESALAHVHVLNATNGHAYQLHPAIPAAGALVASGFEAWRADSGAFYVRDLGQRRTRQIKGLAKANQVWLGYKRMVYSSPNHGDPHQIWLSRLEHLDSADRIFNGYNQDLVLGAGFVAFFGDEGTGYEAPVAVPTAGGPALTLGSQADVPSRLSAYRHDLAFSSTKLGRRPQSTTFHVVRIYRD
jgi:hypothetical protein